MKLTLLAKERACKLIAASSYIAIVGNLSLSNIFRPYSLQTGPEEAKLGEYICLTLSTNISV